MTAVAAVAAVTGWSLASLLDMTPDELLEWRAALPEKPL